MSVIDRETVETAQAEAPAAADSVATASVDTLVFMSYSRKDITFAEQLREALEQRGVHVWVDKRGIHHGEEFGAVIERAIDEATALVFIITPSSVAADSYCLKELRYAEERHKRLLPVLHLEVPKDAPEQVPPSLQKIDYTMLRPDDDFNTEVSKLIEAIHRLPAWHQQHARLLIQATQWEQNPADRSLLLRDLQLRAAERWQAAADGRYQVPTPLELKFIQASEQDERLRNRRRTRLIAMAAVIALALSAIAMTAAIIARQQEARAVYEQNVAVAHSAAASAQLLQRARPNLLDTSVLLSLEALKRAPSLGADTALRAGLSLLPRPLPGGARVQQAQLSPNGAYAAVNQNGAVRVLSAVSGRALSPRLPGSLPSYCIGCAFSPDSRYLMTESRSNQLYVWDASRGWVVALELPQMGEVPTIAFSSDGRFAITVNAAGLTTFWQTGNRWRVLASRQYPAGLQVAVGPGGRRVAIAGSSGQITAAAVWSAGQGWRRLSLPRTGVPYSLGFDPTGRYLVGYGGCDACRAPTMVWDAESGWSRVDLPTSLSAIGGAIFSPNGRYLATEENRGGTDTEFASGLISIWDTATWRAVKRLHQAAAIDSIIFSPDGDYLADAASDGTISVWSVHEGWREVSRVVLSQQATFIAFSASGDVLVSAGSDGVQRWDIAHPWTGVAQTTSAAGLLDTVSPDGRWLVAEPSPGKLQVVDLAAGGQVLGASHRYTPGKNPPQWSVFSSDGTTLLVHEESAAGTNGTGGTTWLWQSGRGWHRLSWSRGGQAVALGPGGKLLLVNTGFRTPDRLWNLTTGRAAGVRGLGNTNTAVFSPDGHYLAAGFNNDAAQTTRVRLWEANQGWQTIQLPGSTLSGSITSLRFSPDGRYLVTLTGQIGPYCSPGPNGALTIWNVQSRTLVNQVTLDDTPCRAAFSSDGQHLAVVQEDGAVSVWTTTDWSEVAQLAGGTSFGAQAYDVSFSRDGRWIITAGNHLGTSTTNGKLSFSDTHVLQRWYWLPADLEQAACARLTHNLSHAEWEQYLTGEPYERTCSNLPAG